MGETTQNSPVESKPNLTKEEMDAVFGRFDSLIESRIKAALAANVSQPSNLAKVAPGQSLQDGAANANPFADGIGSTDFYTTLADSLNARIGKVMPGHIVWSLPVIDLPKGYEARKVWADSYTSGFGRVTEALATTTSNAAMGVAIAPPIMVTPVSLVANLRDTCRVAMVSQGSDRVRFQTINTPSFGSLTENTEPTEVTQTLSKIDLTPTLTGAQQSVSYEMTESVLGDTVAAVNESFRLAELVKEDSVVLAGLDAATPAATLYGDESVSSEVGITSAMTMSAKRIASAIDQINRKGYMANDAVCVLAPKQYGDLLKEIGPTNSLTFWPQAATAGIIPSVYGVEVRRSGGVPTGSGSGSPPQTTYHGQFYIKNRTAGLGISRELLMEAWRRPDKNSTLLKASVRLASSALEPNSLVQIYTA